MAFAIRAHWFPLHVYVVLLFCTIILFDRSLAQYDSDLRGSYCQNRPHQHCCPGRDDTCTAPILGTLCYCDSFCNRTNSADCCPDFYQACYGVPPPEPIVRLECLHDGKYYKLNQSFRKNCNKCTCAQRQTNVFKLVCEQNVCLNRPELIEAINRGPYGWKASNYLFFHDKTLQEGIDYRLGTFKPTRPTVEMYEIQAIKNGPLPISFDARRRWPNLIQPVKDQGNCASSWAFSTTSVASDRLAIESLGMEHISLSSQHLLSCQKRGQRGCQGGHLDKAWYFLRKNGVSKEECFPYTSGENGDIPQCPFKRHNSGAKRAFRGRCPLGTEAVFYQATPPYRVGPKEEEIMREIYYNGPVQATFEVHEDFFLYRSGVYQHQVALTEGLPEQYRNRGWHSIRILGWGVENINGRPVKYWLCANSWGKSWGEDGLFRIVRGSNECDIEMFIVGVWAKMSKTQIHNF